MSAIFCTVFVVACDLKSTPNDGGTRSTEVIAVPPIAQALSVPHVTITDSTLPSLVTRRSSSDSVIFLNRDAVAILTRTGIAVTDIDRVLIFDSTGHLLVTHGRKGAGPGEYENVQAICQSTGDTLVVVDAARARVSVLTPDGRFVRSFSLVMGELPFQHGCLEDGTILVKKVITGARTRFGAFRYTLAGTVRDSSLVLDFENFLGGSLVFAPANVIAYHDSIVFGNPWTGEVHLYSPNGSLQRTLRLTGITTRPIPEDITPWIYPKDGSPMNWPAKVKNLPYFRKIYVASNGDVWYNDYPANKHEAIRWSGFTRDGAPLGTLTIDSSLVLNQSVAIADFGVSSVLLRFEQERGGTTFRILSMSNLSLNGGR
ncbi:MAG: hypothetical protein ABJB74_16725 [Gemmatimonas sp.]